MGNKLGRYTIQHIYTVYKKLGAELKEYEAAAHRFDIDLPVKIEPGAIIPMPADKAEFVARWYLGANKLNDKLTLLDREITRRSMLIGVMG